MPPEVAESSNAASSSQERKVAATRDKALSGRSCACMRARSVTACAWRNVKADRPHADSGHEWSTAPYRSGSWRDRSGALPSPRLPP